MELSSNELLKGSDLWDNLANQNQITPFSDLPTDLAKGLDKVQGFCAAIPKLNGKQLNYHSNEYTILNYCIEEKKVKPAVLKRAILKMEQKALKELGLEFLSKERKKEIKQLAKISELKRAVEDRAETLIVINKMDGWFVIGNGSETACENILSTIRSLIGSFPVVRLSSPAVSTIFTGWVKSGLIPEHTQINESCTLAYDVSSTVYKKQCVVSDEEVLKNIEQGKEVTSLPFTIGELENEFSRVSFSLNDNLKFGSFKYKVNKEDVGEMEYKDRVSTEVFLFCSHLKSIYDFVQNKIINFEVSLEEFT